MFENLKPIKIDRENLMYWWDNQLFSVKSRQKFLLQNENPSYHYVQWQQYQERIKLLSQESKVSKFCMDAGFVHVVEVGQYFMDERHWWFWTISCSGLSRIHSSPDDESSQPKGWIQGDTRIGPILEVTTVIYGENMELKLESGLRVKTILILGSEFLMEQKICGWFKLLQHRSSCRFTWRTSVTIECESCCSQIKGKSKTTEQRNCWITEHCSNEWKKVDWYWTSRILSLCVRGLAESRYSSSTLLNDTTRRWRSSSILENQVLSSESISTKPILVGWSLENMLGSRRRIKKKRTLSLILRYRTMW